MLVEKSSYNVVMSDSSQKKIIAANMTEVCTELEKVPESEDEEQLFIISITRESAVEQLSEDPEPEEPTDEEPSEDVPAEETPTT